MNLRTKQWLIGVLGAVFLASLLFVQAMEVIGKRQEAGVGRGVVSVPTQAAAKPGAKGAAAKAAAPAPAQAKR